MQEAVLVGTCGGDITSSARFNFFSIDTVTACWALSLVKMQVTNSSVLCLNTSCVGTHGALRLLLCYYAARAYTSVVA